MNWLEQRASLVPGRIALREGSIQLSYADLLEESRRVAVFARERMGVQAGQLVVIFPRQSVDVVVWSHACMLLDAVAMPVPARFSPRETAALLSSLRPDAIVFPADHGDDPRLPLPAPSDIDYSYNGVAEEFRVRAIPGNDRVRSFEIPPGTLAILASSGSSGRPKLIPLTYGNFEASARASAANLGTLPDDNWLCVMPLYHVGGLSIVVRAVLGGDCVTLLPSFSEDRVLSVMRTDRVTIASFVPTMLKRLLEYEATFDSGSVPSLRAILLGGAPADADILASCVARRLPVLCTYGLTEGCSQIATMRPGTTTLAQGCVGHPLDGVGLRIRDDRSRDLASGETGEIWIRGDMVAPGYLDPEIDYSDRFHDGWLRTGDIGWLDEAGMLWISGRADNLIVTGGENVYPEEIEAVLCGHPGVEDAAVYGIPDETWGQRLAACVVFRAQSLGGIDLRSSNDARVNIADELTEFCRIRLAGFKIPKQWKFTDSLPRNSAGKILRTELHLLGTCDSAC
jgi:o-succinylbenzoate---CoA ligase